MDEITEIRAACPECGSTHISNLGIEIVEMDENTYIIESGECYDCGAAWKDTYERVSTEVE